MFCWDIVLSKNYINKIFSDFFRMIVGASKVFGKNGDWRLDRIQGSYYQMKKVCAGEGAVYASLCMSLLCVKQQNCLLPSQTVLDCLRSHEATLEAVTRT
jgi:hypothetical protein